MFFSNKCFYMNDCQNSNLDVLLNIHINNRMNVHMNIHLNVYLRENVHVKF